MVTDIRDTTENRRLLTAIMQAIVDSEPDADPDADDTIVISYADLEAILQTSICGEWSKPWNEYTAKEKNEARGWER